MAQTTVNLVGSVLSTKSNMDPPEAIITTAASHDESADATAVNAGQADEDQSSIPPAQINNNTLPDKNDWRSKAKNLHRIVEQIDQEPMGIVIFKWCLILFGSVMLGIVLFLTGEVIYAWSSGELKAQQELALAHLANMRSLNASKVNNFGTTTEAIVDRI